MQKKNLNKLAKDRGKIYGDPEISHKAIGYAIRGVLQNRWHDIVVPEVTSDLTALIFAAFKTVRAARPIFLQDSYDDGHIYLNFSEKFRK